FTADDDIRDRNVTGVQTCALPILHLDTRTDVNENELFEEVNLLIKENPRKIVNNTLKGIVPERFLDYILKRHDIPEDLKCGNLRKDTLQNILEDIKHFKLIVNG